MSSHAWKLTITCPRCLHVGDAEESFDCCEHVEEALAVIDALVTHDCASMACFAECPAREGAKAFLVRARGGK
jgi:hypothetical protein